MPLNQPGAQKILEAVVALVRQQGEYLSSALIEGIKIENKGSIGNLATQLDRETENVLKTRLNEILPGCGLWGEESEGYGSHSRTWVIDPIDGTTNFVHGFPYASVVIALLEGQRPVLGAVQDIFHGLTYYASEGNGAYVIDSLGQAKSLQASGTKSLDQALISFGFPYNRQQLPKLLEAISLVFSQVQDLRRLGSSALDLVNIASGNIDGHFELDLRPWDLLAPSLILKEAGGEMVTWDGSKVAVWSQESKVPVIAANGYLAPELVKALGRLSP